MLKPILTGLFVAGTMVTMSACTNTERGAVIGGATGAAIGGLATGKVGGAVVGAGIGAVTGALIGRSKRRGYCRYRNSRGRIYEARCR